MKKFTSIQIKALLLLIVFAINTVVGFACSVGVDMGFNTKHHNDEAAADVHIHKDGTKHLHSKKTDSASHAENNEQPAKIHIHKNGDKHVHSKKADSASPTENIEQTSKTHIHKDGAKHVHSKKTDSTSHTENIEQPVNIHVHKNGSNHIHPKKEVQNTQSQQKDQGGEIHIHKDGKKHVHPKKAGSDSTQKSKEDCCTDDVRKLSQDDKTVASFLKLSNPVFVTLITFFYNDLLTNLFPQRTVSNKYFVRGHHPPICGIRIVIQSFQI